jgi:Ca2+-binding EF-hand superfamily protein
VLLEAFFAAMKNSENSNRMATQLEEQFKHAAALDPLLATLANFSSPQHLLSQFDIVFEIFDVDDNGRVDYAEMSAGKYYRMSSVPCALCHADRAATFDHG